MAKEFGVLPSQAARDLDADPMRLSLSCLELLEYARAKGVHDTKNKKAMAAYPGQRMLKQVDDIAHGLVEEELSEELAAAEAGEPAAEPEIAAQGETSKALPTQRGDD